VSNFEPELLRRLDADGAPSAARWFTARVAAGELDWPDMSPLEREFMTQILKRYRRWLIEQKNATLR
jgi:hypothetical protein